MRFSWSNIFKKKNKRIPYDEDREWIRFLIIFGLVMLPLYLAYFFAQEADKLAFIKNFTAEATAKILFLTGKHVDYQGDTFIYGDFIPIKVIYECTGIFMMIIFVSGISAYRSTFVNKLFGLAICLPGIYLTNILRLLCLALIGHYAPEYFDFFHNYFWYALFSIILIGMWLFWIDVVVARERKK